MQIYASTKDFFLSHGMLKELRQWTVVVDVSRLGFGGFKIMVDGFIDHFRDHLKTIETVS